MPYISRITDPPNRIAYPPGQRGSVFLFAIVILTVILILGASLIERAQTTVYRASVENRAVRAFHLAEAGINKSIWELNQPNGWLTYAGESGVELPGGFVDVSITPAPAERGLFTTHVTLLATGYLPGGGGAMRYPSTIRAIAYKDPLYFEYAVFGDQSVTVGNGTVTLTADSYTSDDGSYGGTNIAANADIATNSTAADAIKILPQGEVHGDVSVGAGASDPNACVDNKGIITGTVDALTSTNALPSVTVPSDAIELGDVYLDLDQELVLDAGVYHMTDLDIFGNSTVICNGKVVIYIDETSDQATPDVRIGGNGIVNTSQIPANLVVYCCPDVVTVQFSGNAEFYGGLYAPQANITLNAGDVYGSMVGSSVVLNGSNAHVHYDEALRDHSNPNALMRSWEVL
jgi:hypothetical protein